jgi:hypothetical protein
MIGRQKSPETSGSHYNNPKRKRKVKEKRSPEKTARLKSISFYINSILLFILVQSAVDITLTTFQQQVARTELLALLAEIGDDFDDLLEIEDQYSDIALEQSTLSQEIQLESLADTSFQLGTVNFLISHLKRLNNPGNPRNPDVSRDASYSRYLGELILLNIGGSGIIDGLEIELSTDAQLQLDFLIGQTEENVFTDPKGTTHVQLENLSADVISAEGFELLLSELESYQQRAVPLYAETYQQFMLENPDIAEVVAEANLTIASARVNLSEFRAYNEEIASHERLGLVAGNTYLSSQDMANRIEQIADMLSVAIPPSVDQEMGVSFYNQMLNSSTWGDTLTNQELLDMRKLDQQKVIDGLNQIVEELSNPNFIENIDPVQLQKLILSLLALISVAGLMAFSRRGRGVTQQLGSTMNRQERRSLGKQLSVLIKKLTRLSKRNPGRYRTSVVVTPGSQEDVPLVSEAVYTRMSDEEEPVTETINNTIVDSEHGVANSRRQTNNN